MKILALSLSLFVTLSFDAFAAVTFHDDVVVTGTPVMLKAETRGRFFREGGQVVEFYVNGKSTGTALSGGDGIAYKEFTPGKPGLYNIAATAGQEGGCILSLSRGSGVVFIDVIGGLLENPISRAPREGSREALEKITKKYPVVYLHSEIFGMSFMKQWLRSNEFPRAPLLNWDSGGVFDEIDGKGLTIKAVVGSPKVIESAKDYKAKAFSFEEAGEAQEVKDWQEIAEKIEKGL